MTKHVKSIQLENWTVELLPSAPYEVSYTPEQHVIGFSFDRQVGTHSFASDKRKEFQALPNGLAWVPKGCDVYSQSSGGEYLKITGSLAPHKARNLIHPFSDAINRAAINAAFALRRALLTDTATDLLACEQQIMIMESSVFSSSDEHASSELSRGWMNKDQFRKIDEFVESRLDTQLTVNAVARELEVSAGFLSREFKRAVGRTPHQYIIDKRLSYARAQLQQPDKDLSAIAFTCGFSSHSHMSALFRQRFDTTPVQMRNQEVASNAAR